jgi:hypothetical protein
MVYALTYSLNSTSNSASIAGTDGEGADDHQAQLLTPQVKRSYHQSTLICGTGEGKGLTSSIARGESHRDILVMLLVLVCSSAGRRSMVRSSSANKYLSAARPPGPARGRRRRNATRAPRAAAWWTIPRRRRPCPRRGAAKPAQALGRARRLTRTRPD